MGPKIVEMVLIFLAFLTGVGCLTKVLLSFVNRRRPSLDGLDEITQRLARIEQIVDTTAVEVERISEGQRFTSRLLSERPPAAVEVARPAGPRTPH